MSIQNKRDKGDPQHLINGPITLHQIALLPTIHFQEYHLLLIISTFYKGRRINIETSNYFSKGNLPLGDNGYFLGNACRDKLKLHGFFFNELFFVLK